MDFMELIIIGCSLYLVFMCVNLIRQYYKGVEYIPTPE